MITNFQRFIHRHRSWMFLCLLGLFLLPFLFWDYSGTFRSVGAHGVPHVVYGRKVSPREFEVAKRLSRLGAQTANLRDEDLDNLVLKKLALAEKARQMGIVVTDSELREEIQKLPFFWTNGKFDINQYDKIMQNNIVPRGISEDDFGAMIRQDKQIQKLREFVTSTAKVPNQQAASFASDVLEKISAAACKFDASEFVSQVHASDEDLKAYYNSHPDLFRTPDRISVTYVVFPVEANSVQVTDKEIEDYYEQNKNQFAGPDGKPKDLKIVSDLVRKQISGQKAVAKAEQTALDFSVKLLPKQSEKAVSFDSLAKEYHVVPVQTGLFSEKDTLPGIQNRQFVAASFALTKENPVTDPIVSNSGVYVATLHERQESAAIPFEQIKEGVRTAFVKDTALKIARTTGEQKRRELQDMVAAGKSFDQAVAALKLKSQVFKSFSSIDQSGADASDMMVKRSCAQVPTGALTDLEPTPNGAFFAFVLSREKPKPEEVARFQPQVLGFMQQQAAQNVFSDFTQAVLREAGLKNLIAAEESEF